MSEDNLINAKYRILEIFASLDDSESEIIESWISSQAYKKDVDTYKTLMNTEKNLIKIGDVIKSVVPFEAEMPTEIITPPTVGDQADCNSINTVHIDEFLYDDEEVGELVKKGKIKRHYCLDCNSRNISNLTFISHSMSRMVLQYIFKVLLPSDLEDKQILDVGSRLGAVVYGAYYYSNATSIIGIEMNKECCDVQEQIISKFSMDTDRIKIIHSDVLERPDVVQQSDIIVINALDFFVNNEKHEQMWDFFKQNIKKGSYLVSNRSMEETFSGLDIYEKHMNWLNICKPNQLENEIFLDVQECNELYLYTVN